MSELEGAAGRADDYQRVALERARYLERTSDLTARQALAVAYRELGYSKSGIARKVGATESTVEAYLERTAVQHGLRVIETRTKWDEQREGALEESTTDHLRDELSEPVLADYLTLAQAHPEHIPDGVDPYALEDHVLGYVQAVRSGRIEAPKHADVDAMAALQNGWYE